MTSNEFVDLVRGDPALPGLSLALDPAAVAELLAARAPELNWPAGHLRLDYLRYKPGASLVAAVVNETAAGRRFAAVKTFSPASAPKLRKVDRAGAADDVGWGAVIDEDRQVVVHDVTSDRWLPGVRAVLAGARGELDIIRYKPERRLVGRMADHDGLRLVKVHRPGAASPALRAHRRFATAGLPVADVLEAEPRRGVVHYRWLRGQALDTPRSGAASGDLASVGALLAAVHQVEPDLGFSRADLRREVLESVQGIVAVLPGLAPAARAVASSVLTRLSTQEFSPRVLHGDFSADQVVVLDHPFSGSRGQFDRLGLLDLDRVCVGDPAADIASWVAAEMAEGRVSLRADAASAADGLLTGYLPVVPATQRAGLLERLEPLTSAALLQRAVDPFRQAEPGWPDKVAELVAAARRLVDPRAVTVSGGVR